MYIYILKNIFSAIEFEKNRSADGPGTVFRRNFDRRKNRGPIDLAVKIENVDRQVLSLRNRRGGASVRHRKDSLASFPQESPS